MKHFTFIFTLVIFFSLTITNIANGVNDNPFKHFTSVKVIENSPGLSQATFSTKDIPLYKETILLSWENGAWVNRSKTIETWNTAYTRSESIQQLWNNGQWNNEYKYVMDVIIDFANNIIRIQNVETHAWQNSAWTLLGRSTYTYDSNNFLVEISNKMQLGPQLIEMAKIVFINNSVGMPLIETDQSLNFQTMQLENEGKILYTYNNTNPKYLETELEQAWVNSNWYDTTKYTYVRNSLLNVTSELDQYFIGGSGSPINNNLTETNYDQSGKYDLETIYKQWNFGTNQWQLNWKRTLTYNANWDLTLELAETYDSGNYTPWFRTTYTYNSNNQVIEEFTENYIAKGWENSDKRLISYSPTSVSDENGITDYSLAQNYPNPFNPSTTISFQLPNSSVVNLKVFDILGNEVAVLVNNEARTEGKYEVNWDASGFTSGIYFYRLETESGILTNKMTLLK